MNTFAWFAKLTRLLGLSEESILLRITKDRHVLITGIRDRTIDGIQTWGVETDQDLYTRADMDAAYLKGFNDGANYECKRKAS